MSSRRPKGDSFGFGSQPKGRATSFMLRRRGERLSMGMGGGDPDVDYDWQASIQEVGDPIPQRKEGEPVLYSPQQTEKYKSQYLRYERSLKLVPSGIRKIGESIRKFFYQSNSSPNGFWEVTEDRGEGPGRRSFRGGQCSVDYNVTWLNAWRKTNPSNPTPNTDIGNTVMRGPIPDYEVVCKGGMNYPATFNFAQGKVAYDVFVQLFITFTGVGEQQVQVQDAVFGPVRDMRFRQAGAGVIFDILCHGKPHEGVRTFGPRWTTIYQTGDAVNFEASRLDWQLYKRIDGQADDAHWAAIKLGNSIIGPWRNTEDFVLFAVGFNVSRAGFNVFTAPPDNCGNLPRRIVRQPFAGGQCPVDYNVSVGVEWESMADRVGIGRATRIDSKTLVIRGPIGQPYLKTGSVPELRPSGLPSGFSFLLAKTLWVVDGNGHEIEIINLPGQNVTAWRIKTLNITVSRVDGAADNCGPGPLATDGPIVGPLPEGQAVETDFRGYNWSCNCPDWTKKLLPKTDSKYLNSRLGREWEDSSAGAKGDCKHIYATKAAAGVYFVKPNDLPAGGER